MVRGNHYSMDNFWIRLSAWTLAFSFVFGMVFGLFFIASVPFWLLWNWLIPSNQEDLEWDNLFNQIKKNYMA